MNHNGPVAFIVGADIGQVKPFGQVHVQLNGAALPGPADGRP